MPAKQNTGMKTNKDFAYYLENFFMKYLSCEIGASHHTIRSYRDTFFLFLEFMQREKNTPSEKIALNHISKQCTLDFLDWLEHEKGNMPSTRNIRFCALRSFFRYLSYEDPLHMNQWKSNMSIRFKKEHKETVKHMSVEGIKHLLEMIPVDTQKGRRHLTLISLMYETGARVQEIVDLKASSIRFSKPYVIKVCGKGDKSRIIPLDDGITELVHKYMQENGLASQMSMDKPMFFNHSGNKLTPQGVAHILKSYAAKARILYPDDIPKLVSPHMLRHSRAMHLLQSGVKLIYIRDLLGHVSVQSTEVYAKADTKSKREALEKAHPELGKSASELPSWERDPELKAFLKGLTK